MLNALTVDVEDYFHPTEIQKSVESSAWETLPSRIEANTNRVLEILSWHGVKGTFFVLGWVAERYPHVVQSIVRAGHEIGCHSYGHRLVYDLTPLEFKQDTEKAQRAIEEACGVVPRLYRAPSYSITAKSMWALEILCECGFTHDSSIYPVRHDRYGIPGYGLRPQLIQTPSGLITEVPVSTVQLWKGAAPVGGGAYLRLLPYRYTAAGIRRVNAEGRSACIYFHPWELDPEQPHLTRSFLSSLRTYFGLGGMQSKVERLLRDFGFTTMTAVFPSLQPVRAPSRVNGACARPGLSVANISISAPKSVEADNVLHPSGSQTVNQPLPILGSSRRRGSSLEFGELPRSKAV